MGIGKILIVGGNGFLGKSISLSLEERGYECLSYSRKGRNSLESLDLTSKDSIERVCENLKNLDGVIFLSGKEPQQNLKDLSWDHLNEMMMVHLGGIIWFTKKIVDKINPGGFLIFTSSVSSRKGSYDPTYASMKAGIEGLTRTLAKDLAPGIRVNCVSPGLVEDSPVFNRMSEDFRKKHLDTTPLKKFCSTENVFQTFLFAIENQDLTGQILQINGGQIFG